MREQIALIEENSGTVRERAAVIRARAIEANRLGNRNDHTGVPNVQTSITCRSRP